MRVGNFAIETPYKNDKREGIEKEYFENGKLERETPYKNDEREGIWLKWYYENGKLTKKIETHHYKNDKKREGITKRVF